jgi:hypothetical protein
MNSPAAVAWAADRLDIFGVGWNGNLYHWWWNGSSWAAARNLGGNLVDSPSAVSWAANRLDIFALGPAGELFHWWWDGSGWGLGQNLGSGSNLFSSPSAVAWGPGRLDVFSIAAVGYLSHKWWDGNAWGGFESLGAGTSLPQFGFRKTKAFLQSERQLLAGMPIPEDLQAGTTEVALGGLIVGLQPGRPVAVSGIRSDARGLTASEVLVIREILHEGGFTSLKFRSALQYSYVRQTVSINANLAAATHGETVPGDEVLGGGDATQVFQSFALKQWPLTYLRSPLPPGFASSLEQPGRAGLRVNNVRWHEVPTLYGHGPTDRVYTARRNDDGKTIIRFGDGITGARLPTGTDNVRAIYRKSIGVAGNVRAGQLTNLLSRPLGLKGGTNPQDAEGGADPESLADARTNAPLQVLTLNRVVSLQDYEDFARAYPGIAKALATWTWDGRSKGVLLTVAAPGGTVIDEGGEVATKLRDLLSAAGEPFVAVRIKPHQAAAFKVGGGLFVDPDYDPQQVLAGVRTSLAAAFSFEARAFGQPAMLSEAMTTIHSVAGVIGVDVERFYRTDLAPDRNERLLAALPGSGANNPAGAELLTLASGGADDLGVRA